MSHFIEVLKYFFAPERVLPAFGFALVGGAVFILIAFKWPNFFKSEEE